MEERGDGMEVLGATIIAIIVLLLVMLAVCEVTDDDGYWHSNL